MTTHSADAEVDELFGLPEGEFVAARDQLARRLRNEGRRDDAMAVKSLRRPARGAWALNQAARMHPDLVDAALAAGAALRDANDAALRGEVSSLREAVAASRDASGRLTQAAVAQLGATGESLRTVLADTVRAAVLDDEVADQLRRGVLRETHGEAGFGFGAEAIASFVAPEPSTAAPRPRRTSRSTVPVATEPANQPIRIDAALARRRARQLEAAKIAVEQLENRIRSAQDAVDVAKQRWDQSVEDLARAEQELEVARNTLAEMVDEGPT